jgi:hypothetical protein
MYIAPRLVGERGIGETGRNPRIFPTYTNSSFKKSYKKLCGKYRSILEKNKSVGWHLAAARQHCETTVVGISTVPFSAI